MARKEKELFVEDLTGKMNEAASIIFTDYRGLNVAQVTELRSRLREADIEFRVVKNTLARFAAQKANIADLDEIFIGPTAMAFGVTDPVAPAKILLGFAKDHPQLEIKGGVLDGSVIDLSKVEYLAKIPSREELLAKALGSMQAPISGLAMVLSGILRKLLYALNEIKETKAN